MKLFVYCFTGQESSLIFTSPLDSEAMWAYLASQDGVSVEDAKEQYRMQVREVNPAETTQVVNFYCTDGLITLR